MKHIILAFTLLFSTATFACADDHKKQNATNIIQTKEAHTEKAHNHSVMVGDLEISGYSMRPTAMDNGNSAAYMTIKNTGKEDDVLKAVKIDDAQSTMIHNTIVDDKGVASMQHIKKLEIKAGETVTLAPRKHHIMIMGIKKIVNEGDTKEIQLMFEKAGDVKIKAPVVSFKESSSHEKCTKHACEKCKNKECNHCEHGDCKNCNGCKKDHCSGDAHKHNDNCKEHCDKK
jgi:copper(I)-binding protein